MAALLGAYLVSPGGDMTGAHVWGDATTTRSDWVGTVAFEETQVLPSVYEITGIDADEWLIVGLELRALAPARPGQSHNAKTHVIAVRRSELEGWDLWNDRELQAVDLRVHEVDGFELFFQMTQEVDIRLRLRTTEHAAIRITEFLDHPSQVEDEFSVRRSRPRR